MSGQDVTVTLSMLMGTMEFVPPKYSLAKRDNGYWIECDAGVNIGGFASEHEARLAARQGGITLSR